MVIVYFLTSNNGKCGGCVNFGRSIVNQTDSCLYVYLKKCKFCYEFEKVLFVC